MGMGRVHLQHQDQQQFLLQLFKEIRHSHVDLMSLTLSANPKVSEIFGGASPLLSFLEEGIPLPSPGGSPRLASGFTPGSFLITASVLRLKHVWDFTCAL